MKTLPDNIRETRLALGMTQEQLGRAAGGRSVNQINGYERGRARPSPPVLLDIAKALKTTPDVLLGEGLSDEVAPSNTVEGAIAALKAQLKQVFKNESVRVTIAIELA